MNNKYKKLAIRYVVALGYWIFAMTIFYLFRYMGLDEEVGIEITHKQLQRIDNWLIISLIGGSLIGTFYFLVDLITNTGRFKRKSLGHTLLTKVILYLILLLVTGNMLVEIIESLFSVELVKGFLIKKTFFWSFVVFFTFMSLIFSFVELTSVKFGKGVLLNMLLGKYRNPKEEQRIFMFLDLKSSTSIAEKLGHVRYSMLIQQCFYDLNDVILQFDGEIYQYVGDEVVISWEYKRGIIDNRCIEFYFAFKDKLEKRSKYYQNTFGIIPEFKAGLHGGTLIVTEIGIMKKDIAYHGDVINTAARIQGECNKYDSKLLISKELLSDLQISSREIILLGEVVLKGKLQPVVIHAVK